MIKKIIILLAILNPSYGDSKIHITQADNLFVRITVPKKGIVCSNQDRAYRISKLLTNLKIHKSNWGPVVYIGYYKKQKFFIASAPVGSGSGLVFTELYAAGAEFIVRYGSDDVKNPNDQEEDIIKIINETDNLYGYNRASGVPEKEWGKSIFASQKILNTLREEAKAKKLPIEERVCHHLENYHAIRNPEKFSPERTAVLIRQLEDIKRTDKKESFDMESAVLFRIAHDFDKHAAAVLQTVNKKDSRQGPYEGKNREKAISQELMFTKYILDSLMRIA